MISFFLSAVNRSGAVSCRMFYQIGARRDNDGGRKKHSDNSKKPESYVHSYKRYYWVQSNCSADNFRFSYLSYYGNNCPKRDKSNASAEIVCKKENTAQGISTVPTPNIGRISRKEIPSANKKA